MKVLGIITARGGSKGISKKNIKNLVGKPLIAWTIEEALKARKLDRVIVSTDSQEIAYIARGFGAEVPFIRPDHLSQDDSSHVDVLIHAIKWFDTNEPNYQFEYFMLLQPTSPLRTNKDIDKSIELIQKKNVESVVSICESITHPYLMKVIDKGNLVDYTKKPKGYIRRQDFPNVFQLNGAIYLIKTEVFRKEKTLFLSKTCAYEMGIEQSIDIDTDVDFEYAEFLLNNKYNHKHN